MTEGRVTEAEAQEFINAAHTNQQLLGNLLIQNQAVRACVRVCVSGPSRPVNGC
jgi:hypothetical protein